MYLINEYQSRYYDITNKSLSNINEYVKESISKIDIFLDINHLDNEISNMLLSHTNQVGDFSVISDYQCKCFKDATMYFYSDNYLKGFNKIVDFIKSKDSDSILFCERMVLNTLLKIYYARINFSKTTIA